MHEDRRFALFHATPDTRDALTALWLLDVTLGRAVSGTTDSMVGQLRLTWWHDAISGLPKMPVAGQPELDALTTNVLVPFGIAGAEVAPLVEGWEALLDPLPLADAQLTDYASGRGRSLFDLSGRILEVEVDPRAGEAWALADFAGRCSDATTSARAWALARNRLSGVNTARLPRPLRVLTRLSRMDAIADAKLPRSRWALFRSAW